MRKLTHLFVLLFVLPVQGQSPVFVSQHPEHTTIEFSNNIIEDENTNIMKYDYLYNGGGVGIGDFDKNGYPDIFLAGNMVDDQLYFNLGDFKFKDVTASSGINKHGWSTGVCVFDVNGDGWDDIYVCRSGPEKYDHQLENVLYENQGDGTFKENASAYGLNLSGHHTQAAPLDIDLDGDLDLYIMGHPGKFQHSVNFQEVVGNIQSGSVESDILLENVGGKYVDITKSAGISEFGYGLGLAVTDINKDGYPDIIVCNDFDEPDHLFINQQNNTFVDENLSYFKHTTNYSMGNDVGDINNDGLLDYISVDMAFEHHERSKTNMASMNPTKFFARVQLGWGYQYMHNMLHLNTGMGTFQEIAQFAGVAKTDWSWAPLFFDIDMDGYLDLFVSNGYKRDTKNNDIGYLLEKAKEKKGDLSVQDFLAIIPAVKIENFFFRNTGELTFEDKRAEWGVDEKVNSNGAAYADLDLDGDLDLILNNVDTLASVYENTAKRPGNSLIIQLDKVPQPQLAGLVIEAVMKNGSQYRQAYFVRGYASTVEKKIFFYSNTDNPFDHIVLHTPHGKKLHLGIKKSSHNVIQLKENLSYPVIESSKPRRSVYFEDVTDEFKLDALHKENDYNDFEDESLLPHKMTTSGPEIAVGDLDNNGLDDFIVTSSAWRIPIVYLQNPNGTFKKMISPSCYNHQTSEDADVFIFDVNGDNNQDLFITSGGYQWAEGDTALENRLYIGNGLGMFGLVNNATPLDELTNSGKIIPEDIDQDGDIDFLICGKGHPKKYPFPGKTKIYINDNGFYKDQTAKFAPGIEDIGMVNDACFSDVDNDGDKDILLVGEWMKIEWLENKDGIFHFQPFDNIGWPGWWTCIKPVDIDNDGDDDYLLGNAGMNNKFRANPSKPLEVYANDFDDNGSIDIVLAYSKGDHKLPVRGKECSSGQMPFIKEKFPTYLSFATSELEQIYPKEKLEEALHYTVTEFRSGILYNNGTEGMSFAPFPSEAQFSFINAYQVMDINRDGRLDVVAVGNRFNTEVETTRYDAGCGIVLIQNGDGTFRYVPPRESGFFAPYNAKSLEFIKLGKDGTTGLLVGNNNSKVQLFRFVTND